MVNNSEWFWASEYGRDRLLREELEAQAGALAASRARQQRDTSKLRSELRNMQGSLEARLNALTNAFVAFVELDGIRKQLAAFPQHAEARRCAFQDLQVLLDGGVPPMRPDVDGYWLPPAMSALRPDGSVDPEQAALARQRDPQAAPVFLATARAAFGAGEAVAAELPKLLTPDDQGTWAEWQLLLWGATLRGAFGPAALTTLTATFRPLIASADNWLEWARSQAGTNDAKALDWVTSQLEELAPRGTPEQETGWTATGTGRPDFVIRGSGRIWDASNRPEPEPEETAVVVEETTPEENAWESTRAMLVRVMQVHIRGGSESEHALLARAELLEEQFNNPLGASKLPDEVPEKRHIVIDALRQTAPRRPRQQTGPPQPVVADRRDLRAGRAGMADGTGAADPGEEGVRLRQPHRRPPRCPRPDRDAGPDAPLRLPAARGPHPSRQGNHVGGGRPGGCLLRAAPRGTLGLVPAARPRRNRRSGTRLQVERDRRGAAQRTGGQQGLLDQARRGRHQGRCRQIREGQGRARGTAGVGVPFPHGVPLVLVKSSPRAQARIVGGSTWSAGFFARARNSNRLKNPTLLGA